MTLFERLCPQLAFLARLYLKIQNAQSQKCLTLLNGPCITLFKRNIGLRYQSGGVEGGRTLALNLGRLVRRL